MKYICVLISVTVMFWNVENYFDYFDSEHNDSDTEFSPLGNKHWTKKKFLAKSEAIAKTVFALSDLRGQIPDIVAFAEIENGFVLKRLVSETGLRKCDYKIVHYESGDHRGIDVGLIYNPASLELISSRPIKIPLEATRDILLCCFKTIEGDSLAILVNHFPSKYSGDSSDGRLTAARTLIDVCDSIETAGWRNILALGDFNETPSEKASIEIATRLRPLLPGGKPEGTIKFDGLWEQIDQAFATGPFSDNLSLTIFAPPFLLTKDSSHSGLKPFRTFSGPRYNGGVSDHLPIIVELQ